MRLYRWLFQALPRAFRDEYGAELLATVEAHWVDVRERGNRVTRIRFWFLQFGALVRLVLRLRRPTGGPDARTGVFTRSVFAIHETLFVDGRDAVRSLRRKPAATLGITVVLAGCIGTATLVFSLADGILRRPPPYPDPAGVVLVSPVWLDGRASSRTTSAAEYVEVGRRSTTLARVGAIDHVERTLIADGLPETLPGALVSASVFTVLGVEPALGRTFDSRDDRPNGPDLVVLSDGLWRRAFGGDASAIGRTVRLEDRRYEVIGVMPAGFVLPTEIGALDPSTFFLPLRVDPAEPGPIFVKNLNGVIARLAPGASVSSATADVARIATQIVAEHPDNYQPGEWTLQAVSPLEAATAQALPILRLLILAVGLLVVAACANLAGLLAARVEERRREVAVRKALGAGRIQTVRRTAAEGILLAGAGATLGIGVASYALPFARTSLATTLPRIQAVELHTGVAAFSMFTVLATALLFTVIPALQAANAEPSLAARGVGGATRRARFRRILIGAQLALAAVLLCGSVLFVRSVQRLMAVDPGFRSAGVQTVALSLPSSRYTTADVETFYARLVAELRAAPGVKEAGIARRLPMADRYGTWTVAVRDVGPDRRLDEDPPRWQVVTPGYFDALAIDVTEGRTFTDADLAGEARVALVNGTFARRYWPGRSAVGTQLRMDGGPDNPWLTIVGVVADVRNAGPRAPTEPIFYIAHPHFARASSVGTQRSMSLVLETSLDAEATRSLLRSRIAILDPELPLGPLRAMDDIVAASFAETRILTQVLSVFALLTLLLGAIGIYGTLSYEVAARSRELGIRAALGANANRILTGVLGEGTAIGLAGTAIGIALAVTLAELASRYLFGVGPHDLLTFVIVALTLLATVVAASLSPALRAASVDPMTSLRMD